VFQKLVSHNPDLKLLVEKGYAVAIDGGYLLVRDIPYLDSTKALQWGAFVAKLVFTDTEHFQQDDHQVFFAGSVPHGLDGRLIPNLGGGAVQIELSAINQDVKVERSFSNKPKATGAFANFFEKIESYVTIVAGPAMELHNVTPYTFRVVESMPDSVFKIHDTLSSRAEITDLAKTVSEDVVAVIGLGGTGSYVLDMLVKTPIREIRGFDGDMFHVHNAFRSPGQLNLADLGQSKAAVYNHRYDSLRHGLVLKAERIDETNAELLDGVTFAFVCIDSGTARAEIFELLAKQEIPFIDVGMGLQRKNGSINGMLRTTFFSAQTARETIDRGFAPLSDDAENIYKSNIQIAELNALNACLAVIKYKQLRGFYYEEEPLVHQLFEIGDMKIVGE